MSGPVSIGAASGVGVADIESELRRLWQGVDAAEGEAGLTRACVLNLIILSESGPQHGAAPPAGGSDQELTGLVAAVTREHPCRVIRVRSRPAAPDAPMRGFVSAFCHAAGAGARQVCCEQISLAADGRAAGHLHATLAALLVADLPVLVWWRGRPPWGSHRLQRLAGLADRLVVDSAEAPDPLTALVELAGWCGAQDAKAGSAGDLVWRRLSGWREATAALFDPPSVRPLLGAVDRVELFYGGAQRPDRVQVLYLAGWLASRLGWRPLAASMETATGGLCLQMEDGRGPRRLKLRLSPEVDARVAVLECSEAGVGTATSTVEWAGEGALEVGWDRPGRRAWARRLSLPALDRGRLLARELEFLRVDPVQQEALAVAGSMARLWQEAVGKP